VDTRNHTSIGSESEFNAEALQGSEAGWKLFTFWEGMYLFDTVWGTDVGSNETGFNALPGGLIGDVDEIGQGGEMQSETAKVQEWSGWWGADRSCLVIGDHVDGDNHDSVNLIRFDNIYSGMYVRLVKKN